MAGSPIQSDEVDGAALKAIVRRFRAHHALRLARTGERLITRHRRVLEALPMLYHRNHPALPGWVGPHVPHGIANFRPGAIHLRALRMVARTYEEPRLPSNAGDLHGIFMMGSGGTIGQSRGSDIDLWVCCDSLMHATLWPKVRMIDQWAAELGLELHTFLVDPDALRVRRRLPGTRIPMLVLDEFYRTGALMAGRYPLWWLVPEDDPDRYAETAERLLRQRFVARDAVVDFGVVPPFPADELAQAAITELDRALATPHKSLLKLKLVEAYAESPDLGAVSSGYRARVHGGETRPLALDPYLLLYDHVETHLLRHGRHRELAFARSLLIGKTAESIPFHAVARGASGPAAALLTRFAEWGFDADAVARFRGLERWSMRERLAEHRRIMSALDGGVHLVEKLVAAGSRPHAAERSGADGAPRLEWLNQTRLRQLRVAVNTMRPHRSGGIPVLHPALISRRRPVDLELRRGGAVWTLCERGEAVRHCGRLIEAVMWAELNGAALRPERPDPHLSRLLAQVLQGFRGPQRTCYAFANVEARHQRVPPWEAASRDAGAPPESTLLSARNDPMDYGGFHQLHLETLDVVSRDASGHWCLESLVDPGAVLEGLGRLLASPPREVSWLVPGGRERFLLAHRLEKLHILARRILDAPGAMFVLPFGADTVSVRRHGEAVETRRHGSLDELQAYVRATGSVTVGVDPVSHRLRALLRAS